MTQTWTPAAADRTRGSSTSERTRGSSTSEGTRGSAPGRSRGTQAAPEGRRVGQVLVPVALGVAVLGLGALSAFTALGSLVALGVFALALVCCLPTRVLPSVVLIGVVLVPVGYLAAVPEIGGRYLSPGLVLLLLWVVKSLLTRADRQALAGWLVVFVVVLGGLTATSINPVRSSLWTLALLVGAVLPGLLGPRADPRTAALLLRTWLVLGVGLGGFAVAESVLQVNPLTGLLSTEQHWAVYRVTTTLGHPLVSGAFFAVTGCLAWFTFLRGRLRRLALICFALSGFGTALTGSRSGVYALLGGLAVGMVLVLLSRRTGVAVKVAGLAALAAGAAAIPHVSVLAARSSSQEGAASVSYRQYVFDLATGLFLRHPVAGVGPGTSAQAATAAGAQLPLENAALGTLVSVGVVGCALLVAFLGHLAWRALRRHQLGTVAGMVAFLLAGSAFPLWETNPALLVLLGLLVVVAGPEPDHDLSAEAGAEAAPPLPRRLTRRPRTVAGLAHPRRA
ncbi:MAG: hypothetical protein JWP61_3001, partial [Friedmanniella sp.]|nr:hypothetical protein [Friedmanniella sp.]